MRYLGWTVEEFDKTDNPKNCEIWILVSVFQVVSLVFPLFLSLSLSFSLSPSLSHTLALQHRAQEKRKDEETGGYKYELALANDSISASMRESCRIRPHQEEKM